MNIVVGFIIDVCLAYMDKGKEWQKKEKEFKAELEEMEGNDEEL